MGGKRSEEEVRHRHHRRLQAGRIIGCTGDGVPPFIHEAGFAAIAAAGTRHSLHQALEDAELYDKLAEAVDTGASVVGMDIDAAGLITLRKMGRPVSPKPVDTLREIIAVPASSSSSRES